MKRIITFSLLFFSFSDFFSQDIRFLNYNQSLLYFNPSFAGSNGGFRNQFSYRHENPFPQFKQITFVNSFDGYVDILKAGLGFTYLRNDILDGLFTTEALGYTYAQHISSSEKRVKFIPSVQATIQRRTVDLVRLFPPGFPPPATTLSEKFTFDISAGFLFNYRQNFRAGFYIFHLNQPNVGPIGNQRLFRRGLLHASYNFNISEQDKLQLAFRIEGYGVDDLAQIAATVLIRRYLIIGAGYTANGTRSYKLGMRNNFMSFVVQHNSESNIYWYYLSSSWVVHAGFYLRNRADRTQTTLSENW